MAQLSDFSEQTQERLKLVAASWGTTTQFLIDNHYDFCASLESNT